MRGGAVSYRDGWNSFPLGSIYRSRDRLRLLLPSVLLLPFLDRRGVQIDTGQGRLQERKRERGMCVRMTETVLLDRLTANTLTGVMICERGRRSVTRGRDAVGWLSFSVDDTTASRSTSAHTGNTKTRSYGSHTRVPRQRWNALTVTEAPSLDLIGRRYSCQTNSPAWSGAESGVEALPSDLGLSLLSR